MHVTFWLIGDFFKAFYSLNGFSNNSQPTNWTDTDLIDSWRRCDRMVLCDVSLFVYILQMLSVFERFTFGCCEKLIIFPVHRMHGSHNDAWQSGLGLIWTLIRIQFHALVRIFFVYVDFFVFKSVASYTWNSAILTGENISRTTKSIFYFDISEWSRIDFDINLHGKRRIIVESNDMVVNACVQR